MAPTAAATFETADVEAERYQSILESLALVREWIEGRSVLDFGCSTGLSVRALLASGAGSVVGTEPDAARVQAADPALPIIQTAWGPDLPFPDAEFDAVLANAVLEHIPPPRTAYVRELWRVLRPGGALIINETPNKYFPKEKHTTDLWFNHWLPKRVAHRRALARGRFDPARRDWDSSGWRGVGYFELARAIPGPFTLIPDLTRPRHRVLNALGIPASILDPYPLWVFRKD